MTTSSPAIIAATVLLGQRFFAHQINCIMQFLPLRSVERMAGAFFAGLAASGPILPMIMVTMTLAALLSGLLEYAHQQRTIDSKSRTAEQYGMGSGWDACA